MEKLGDLSKIDISAEVTKLLSSISQTTNAQPQNAASDPPSGAAASGSSPKASDSSAKTIRDPRLIGATASGDGGVNASAGVAEARSGITPPKISIYEQGSISAKDQIELEERRQRQDVDLRNLDTTNIDLDMRTGFGDTDLRQSKL